MWEELLAFVGVLLGCLARSIMPFLRKLRRAAEQGRIICWDHRYTATLAASAFLSLAAAALIMPSLALPGPISPIAAFCLAFAIGFGSNGFLNELAKQAGVV